MLATPWSIFRRSPGPEGVEPGIRDLPEAVLLPGVYEHWTFLRPLGDSLSAAGYRVRVVHGLGTNRRSVVQTSERLGQLLERTPRRRPAGCWSRTARAG